MKVKEIETFELTFYKGSRIRRLVAKDGKPLSPKEEADAQKDVEKRIREIEKREADKERKEREASQKASKNSDGKNPDGKNPDGDGAADPEEERKDRPSIADVLRASRLTSPRRERFRSRDVIVFDFEPLPGYKPRKNYRSEEHTSELQSLRHLVCRLLLE